MKTEKEIKERLEFYENRLKLDKKDINKPEYQSERIQNAIISNIITWERVISEIKYILS